MKDHCGSDKHDPSTVIINHNHKQKQCAYDSDHYSVSAVDSTSKSDMPF